MNDDELTERLASTLRDEASRITSPPDAWERFRAATPIVPMRRPDRRLWLAAPAGAVGIAAAIALVVLVVQNGGSTAVKASSSASSFAAAGSPIRSGAAAGTAGGAGSGGSASGGVAAGNAAGSGGSAGASSGTAGAVAPPAPSAQSSASALTNGSAPAGGPVPAGFEPSSVTFVSAADGWVLGTAPCGAPPCTSLLRTTDGGATWLGIPAPADALSAGGGAPGITEIRFATPLDGWAFGPDLWATHDGGASWHRVTLTGALQVSALEASAGRVWAAVLGNAGKVRLFGSPVASDAWTESSVDVDIGAGPVPSTQIVLQGTSGWLIEVDRTVVGGARLAGGQWSSWTPPCSTVEGPAVLAAWSASDLIAVCDVGLWGGSSAAVERTFTSHDGGATFAELAGAAPGDVGAVAAADPNYAVVAAGSSLFGSTDGGHTWSPVLAGSGAWWDLGFTTAAQGVVINGVQHGQGARLMITHNSGRTWQPVNF